MDESAADVGLRRIVGLTGEVAITNPIRAIVEQFHRRRGIRWAVIGLGLGLVGGMVNRRRDGGLPLTALH